MTDIVETIADCLVEDHIGLMKQLAAAQARIKELREHLALAVLYGPPMAIGNVLSKNALATPDDSSALDAALEEAYSNGYDVGCADATGYMK